MLNVAIYGMGNWGSRLIESVQGKSSKIRFADRKSTRLNSSHIPLSRMPSSA